MAAKKATLVWTADQEKALELLQGAAHHVMLYGGSRSGKSLLLVAAIVHRALKAPGSRHVIFRHRFNHCVSSIGMDTLPTVMAKRFPDIPYKIDRTRWVATFRGGSELWLAGLDDKERTEKILGQEYATLFFNECSQISYEAVLMARTRLAQKAPPLVNRAYYDINPAGSRHWTSLLFISKKDPGSRPIGAPLANPDNFSAMQMNPSGNRENLPPEYMVELDNMPDRQRRRFRDGLPTAELDNALWRSEFFRPVASDPVKLAEECDRVVVAVDPSGVGGAEDERSDMVGIVVAGRRRGEKRYVVLADRTMRGSVQQWAGTVCHTFRAFKANSVVAETNFGKAMVAHVIRTEDPNVPVKEVTASRGKSVRADPIAQLYEQGRVEHVAGLGDLEDQCCNMSPAGYHGERSPDRVDALVWALSELSQGSRVEIYSPSQDRWI